MYAYFNIIHIMYLFLPIVLLVCLYNIFKDKSAKVKKIVLIIMVSISSTIVIVDMFLTYSKLGIGWKGLLRNVPLFPCDLTNVFLWIVILSKKQKPLLNKYLLYFGLCHPFYTIFAPVAASNRYWFYEYQVWRVFVSESIYISGIILFLKFNHIQISSKQPWKVGILIIAIMTFVHGMNLLMYNTGANLKANYFFTMQPFDELPIAYRCYVRFLGDVPWIRNYIFMWVGYVGMTIIFYWIHKVCETEAFARFVQKTKGFFKKLFTRNKQQTI